MEPLSPGQIFQARPPPDSGPTAFQGSFILDRRLAVGGMAEVWAAHREDSEDRVAIKFLREGLDGDDALYTMFIDESGIASTLRHPNILRVFGGFEQDGRLYQVMELVDGVDLRKILAQLAKAKSRIPIPIVMHLVRDVARALAYAHSRRDAWGASLAIIHRDVSPQNVLVGRDGSVQLLDFGVARARDRLTKTRTGVIKGKVAYMAPEQAMAKELSARTDVFALGVLFWEMMAMKRLFKRGSDSDILARVCKAEVPDPRETGRDLPEGLVDLCLRMLARKPEDRPRTMREVEDALTSLAWGPLASGPVDIKAWAKEHAGARRRTAPLDVSEEGPPPLEGDATPWERVPKDAPQPPTALDQPFPED